MSVDNTNDAQAALKWAVDNLARPGDSCKVVHVLCETGEAHTAVGQSAMGRLTYDDGDMFTSPPSWVVERRRRMANEAQGVIDQRCTPVLEGAGMNFEVRMPRISGPRSAASIGAAICKEAEEDGGRVVVVANHGPGFMAQYGSVARYVFCNSHLPVVLVPSMGAAGSSSDSYGHEVMLVVATAAELQLLGTWLAKDGPLRKGDELHIMYAPTTVTTGAPSPRLELPPVLKEMLKELGAGPPTTTTLLPPATSSGVEAVAQKVVDAIAPPVRLVVMVNNSMKGLLSEAVLGSLSSFVSRHSSRPLLLVQPGK